MKKLKRIGVLAHPLREQTEPVAEEIAEALSQQGIETCVYVKWTEDDVRETVSQCDAVIAIGGDGAMLRAARVCAPFEVPVLGINMGHLGFLTEVTYANTWPRYLKKALDGDYWIEERMMIDASIVRDGDTIASGTALNDVVISREHVTRMAVLETYIDKHWTTTYNADGLIIATATGSTAYALAVGGPILPPELRNILLIPVAPHLSMDRPIVLSEGSLVEVVIAPSTTASVAVAVDGGLLTNDLQPGDCIAVQAAADVSRFVRMRGRNYFYRSLLDRLEPRIPLRSRPDRREI